MNLPAYQSDPADERAFPELIHALRTHLNHVIGLSEYLADLAEETGDVSLKAPLELVAAAGRSLFVLTVGSWTLQRELAPGPQTLTLWFEAHPMAQEIIEIARRLRAQPSVQALEEYREDLTTIIRAAEGFLRLAKSSGLIRR